MNDKVDDVTGLPVDISPIQKPERLFKAKSQLEVNYYDAEWMLLPNKGKGHTLKIGWVHTSGMPEEHKEHILDVMQFYAENRSASTAATVNYAIEPFLTNGIPSLNELKAKWSGLQLNQKKGMNSFFNSLVKIGNLEYKKHHNFTTANLDKENRNPLNPKKGALTEVEFDDLSSNLNRRIESIDWKKKHNLDFFCSLKFGEMINVISSKLLISIIRRPKQLALSKWSDIIPLGCSYSEKSDNIVSLGSLGSQDLQIRAFKIKENSSQFQVRDRPEKYPLHIHNKLSLEILRYKKVYLEGVKLLLQENKLNFQDSDVLRLMDNMPVFPDQDIFHIRVKSLHEFESLFHYNSQSFHTGESKLSNMKCYKLKSDRFDSCVATPNRIRHTVLTRGAQDGMSAAQLAKLTGVTEPAARHYIDLDYRSRKLIDDKYIGNSFLKTAFSTFLSDLDENGEFIYDSNFNAVGGTNNKKNCNTCSAKLGRPIGCYGCYNFKPILEADHASVLLMAEKKRTANAKAILSPLKANSIEKLNKQIAYIKLTIDLCQEILLKRSSLNAQ